MKKIIIGIILMFSSICLFSCGNNENNSNTVIPTDKQYEIYTLAKESGFKGTYEEWLDSIKGDFIEIRVNKNVLEWKYSKESRWTEL